MHPTTVQEEYLKCSVGVLSDDVPRGMLHFPSRAVGLCSGVRPDRVFGIYADRDSRSVWTCVPEVFGGFSAWKYIPSHCWKSAMEEVRGRGTSPVRYGAQRSRSIVSVLGPVDC